MNLSPHRLPKIVALHLLHSRSQFFDKWDSLAHEVGVQLSLDDPNSWNDKHKQILEGLAATARTKFIDQARKSETRAFYRSLIYDMGVKNYFSDTLGSQAISLIFKARTEVLHLNYRPYITGVNTECSMCNLHEREDTFHFIALCPVLKEIRQAHWGTQLIDMEKFEKIQNGENWVVLANYLREALQYRHQIITEDF